MSLKEIAKTNPIQRSSKISKALKRSLINYVFDEGMSTKKAADKLKMNYSSAKVIIQRYRRENQTFSEKIKREEQEGNKIDMKQKKITNEKSERCKYKEIGSSENPQNSQITQPYKKIRLWVFSTVAWDFMRDGLPTW